MKNVLISLSFLLLPFMSIAHPGHGPVDEGISHYVLSPIHFIGIAAVIALVALLFVEAKRRIKKDA